MTHTAPPHHSHSWKTTSGKVKRVHGTASTMIVRTQGLRPNLQLSLALHVSPVDSAVQLIASAPVLVPCCSSNTNLVPQQAGYSYTYLYRLWLLLVVPKEDSWSAHLLRVRGAMTTRCCRCTAPSFRGSKRSLASSLILKGAWSVVEACACTLYSAWQPCWVVQEEHGWMSIQRCKAFLFYPVG